MDVINDESDYEGKGTNLHDDEETRGCNFNKHSLLMKQLKYEMRSSTIANFHLLKTMLRMTELIRDIKEINTRICQTEDEFWAQIDSDEHEEIENERAENEVEDDNIYELNSNKECRSTEQELFYTQSNKRRGSDHHWDSGYEDCLFSDDEDNWDQRTEDLLNDCYRGKRPSFCDENENRKDFFCNGDNDFRKRYVYNDIDTNHYVKH